MGDLRVAYFSLWVAMSTHARTGRATGFPTDARDGFELDAVEEVHVRQRLSREQVVESDTASDRLSGGGVLPKPTQPLHFGLDLRR